LSKEPITIARSFDTTQPMQEVCQPSNLWKAADSLLVHSDGREGIRVVHLNGFGTAYGAIGLGLVAKPASAWAK